MHLARIRLLGPAVGRLHRQGDDRARRFGLGLAPPASGEQGGDGQRERQPSVSGRCTGREITTESHEPTPAWGCLGRPAGGRRGTINSSLNTNTSLYLNSQVHSDAVVSPVLPSAHGT